MIDLYALHTGFPGFEEAEKLRNDPRKRVESLESSWSKDVGDPRFIPFLQLHEYEAYLFCDTKQFELFYEESGKKIAELAAIADGVASPELIDDCQETAPSKRIIAAFPEYEAAKTTVGPQVAELIGLQNICQKCPHFDAWLTKLEQL